MPEKTILLVEDHEDNRTIYRTILLHFGYRVLEAADGREGLEVARDAIPDLVLMDVALPFVDGLEATRTLKADPATAGIPVIALTAHARPEDRVEAEEAGCDSYLAKPVEPQRVIDEVRRFIGAPDVPAVPSPA